MGVVNLNRDLLFMRYNNLLFGAQTTGGLPEPALLAGVNDVSNPYHTREHTISANIGNRVANGFQFIGPDETDGATYRVKGSLSSNVENVTVRCYAGILNAAGDGLDETFIIGSGRSGKTIDEVVEVRPFGDTNALYALRPIVFGWWVTFHITAGVALAGVLSVQRLSVRNEPYVAVVG